MASVEEEGDDSATTFQPLPRPPEAQSAAQKETVFAATQSAEEQHEAARATVEALFDDASTREAMREWCPSIASLDAAELTARFEAEFAAVELVSNFEAATSPDASRNGDEMSLDMLEVDGYWANQWQALFAGGAVPDGLDCGGYAIGDGAECGLYGFPAFSRGDCLPSSFSEASDRPLYSAVNTQRIDVGNPQFGDVTLVWSRRYAAEDAVIMSYLDTGMWEMMCDDAVAGALQSTRPPTAREEEEEDAPPESEDEEEEGPVPEDHPALAGGPPMFAPANCWVGSPKERGLGSTSSFLHLVPSSQLYYNETNWLARSACRMLSTEPWGLETPVLQSETLQYWEAVVAKTPYVEDHNVRFVVASFKSLFGDVDSGARLREICKRQRWVLLWGYGDLDGSHTGQVSANQRLLDPLSLPFLDGESRALFGGDLGGAASFEDAFERHWTARAAVDGDWRSFAWKRAYASLKDDLPTDAQLAPLAAANACKDLNSCVGATLQTGDCVCYDDNVFDAQPPPLFPGAPVARIMM